MSTNNERPTPRTEAARVAHMQWAARFPHNGTTDDKLESILNDPEPIRGWAMAAELERELIVSVNAMVEMTDKFIKLTAERDAYKASYEDLAATFH